MSPYTTLTLAIGPLLNKSPFKMLGIDQVMHSNQTEQIAETHSP